MVFSANPEDYTNRGSIITPLRDRISSQILTHYPRTLDEGMAITSQESWTSRGKTARVDVPDYLRSAIEEVAFQARASELVDQSSGVSARVTIALLENTISSAERRAFLANDEATVARIADVMQGAIVTDAPILLRPLFETTTINFSSSLQTSERRTPTLDLPSRFFLNFDVLSTVLGLNMSPFTTVVQRTLYTNTLTKFAFRLQDGAFIRQGDTHFAFFVPEPAQEDVAAIQQLLAQHVITLHFAISVLMVDFPNPVFSMARSRLLQYVPATGNIQNGRSDLAERTAQAIVQAAPTQPVESPERQFVALWNLSPNQLQKEAEKRIKHYLDAVQQRLKTQVGLDDYTRLAEARRQQFATTFVNLNEFPLLLPKTNLPSTVLQMHADGTVSP